MQQTTHRSPGSQKIARHRNPDFWVRDNTSHRRSSQIFDLMLYTTGWWLSPTPLKNDGIRQMGSYYSQYHGKVIQNSKRFQSPPISHDVFPLPEG